MREYWRGQERKGNYLIGMRIIPVGSWNWDGAGRETLGTVRVNTPAGD